MLETTHIFTARTGGYRNYRVPGILCTRSGIVLATVEARRDSGGDWADNDILLRRSLDGGRNWLPPQLVVGHAEYGPGPISNFVMIGDCDGTLHALYCHNYARVFYMRSQDDGASFDRPTEITASLEPLRRRYPWRVIAAGPGHGIQLSSGRLLAPVWISTGETNEFGAGKLGHRPSDVASIYSDDGGATWQCGDTVVRHGALLDGNEVYNPSETVAVQLSDGRVLFNIRSESAAGRRLIATSPDGASDWQVDRWDEDLLEPVCMGSILRLNRQSDNGMPLIVFANPDNLENELTDGHGHLAHDRKRLTVKLSADDCDTWMTSRVLESGPSGYSDLAETPECEIICIYEDGMLDHMTDTRFVTVASFGLEWLRGG